MKDMKGMNDWLVTVLISVRDMASEAGNKFTAERLDEAILTAVNEIEHKEKIQLHDFETPAKLNEKGVAQGMKQGEVRRYH